MHKIIEETIKIITSRALPSKRGKTSIYIHWYVYAILKLSDIAKI